MAKEKAALMLRKGKITAEEIREYFPELLESDIQELEAEFVPLVLEKQYKCVFLGVISFKGVAFGQRLLFFQSGSQRGKEM
ncbi:hypothetical protein AALB64_04695 [Lachnospiraceae bacterium 45-P1]